jgi:valyl-tRNA synthetase
MKLLNVSKFVLGTLDHALEIAPGTAELDETRAARAVAATAAGVTEPIDLALLAQLADVVDRATRAFAAYDYTRALEAAEEFFWAFCDDYVEVVKVRAYDSGAATESARAALLRTLDTLLRLFAPFLPFATEEIWSWWQDGSVHAQAWPAAAPSGGDPALLATVATVIGAVRKAKSEAKLSQRAAVETLTVTGTAEVLDRVRALESDIAAAGSVSSVVYVTAGVGADVGADAGAGAVAPLGVAVTLAVA